MIRLSKFGRWLLPVAACVLIAQTRSGASVGGSLVEEFSGRGVAGVRIQLSGGALSAPLLTVSDEEGRFRFTDLPPGRYRVRTEKAGFFESGAEFEHGPASLSLEPIVLTAKRIITGTVMWNDGEPAARVRVYAWRVRGGKVPLDPRAMPAVTNDRGEFRLAELRPGSYVLYATPLAGFTTATQRPRAALPLFFPGGPMPALPGLDLRIRLEAPPVHLVLQEMTGQTVSGIVPPSEDFPEGSRVSIGLAIPFLPADFVVRTTATAGSAFSLPGVPPGDYALVLQATNGLPEDCAVAAAPLAVRGQPVSNAAVPLLRRSTIEGSVEFEDANGRRPS